MCSPLLGLVWDAAFRCEHGVGQIAAYGTTGADCDSADMMLSWAWRRGAGFLVRPAPGSPGPEPSLLHHRAKLPTLLTPVMMEDLRLWETVQLCASPRQGRGNCSPWRAWAGPEQIAIPPNLSTLCFASLLNAQLPGDVLPDVATIWGLSLQV